jgi:hypothetical protein
VNVRLDMVFLLGLLVLRRRIIHGGQHEPAAAPR